MDWQSIINTIAIPINIILICVNVYITYKARTSPYREAIYSKQIEGYVELANAINETGIEVDRFLSTGGLKTEERSEQHSRALDKIFNTGSKHLKWLILLPKEIGLALMNFIEECERILNLPYNKENRYLLADSHIKTLNEIRNAAGIEPLSRETLKLIEKIKS